MPADFLAWLPGLEKNNKVNNIEAFDPFQPDL